MSAMSRQCAFVFLVSIGLMTGVRTRKSIVQSAAVFKSHALASSVDGADFDFESQSLWEANSNVMSLAVTNAFGATTNFKCGLVTTLTTTTTKKFPTVIRSGDTYNVFQQRRSSRVDFYRGWSDYASGFGSAEDFWMGLEDLHVATTGERCGLRIELRDKRDGSKCHIEYDSFSIGDAYSDYTLHVGSPVDGSDCGDSLALNNGAPFSTKDRDHDSESYYSCAEHHHGAWWYGSCGFSSLNGLYGSRAYKKGPIWRHWKGDYTPLDSTMMFKCGLV